MLGTLEKLVNPSPEDHAGKPIESVVYFLNNPYFFYIKIKHFKKSQRSCCCVCGAYSRKEFEMVVLVIDIVFVLLARKAAHIIFDPSSS